MNFSRLCIFTALITAPLSAMADRVGFSAGGGVWQSTPSGTVGNTQISIDNTLNLKEENGEFIFFALEHPIPILPNFRIAHTDLQWAEQGTITAGTSLDQVVFPADQQVDVDLDLSHTEVTFYYEILDNIVDLDLGLTARLFDGEASLVGAVDQEYVELDAVVPLLYGKVGVNFPFTGLSASVSGNWVNANEFRLIDWSAQIDYDFKIAPTLEAGLILGYRTMVVEIDDLDELQSDAEFDGLFLALQIIF